MVHDFDRHAWLALDRLDGARVPLRWRRSSGPTFARHGLLHGLGVRHLEPGGNRRPQPPSRRLPPAHMGRAAFITMVGGWLAAIAALGALVLVLRAFA